MKLKHCFVFKALCPYGFIPDNSGEICYNFLTTPATADVSKSMCQQLYNGATLPVFRSSIEYQNFINHTKYKIFVITVIWVSISLDFKIVYCNSFAITKLYWIGARRLCNSVAGNRLAFLWIDGSPMEFQWWNAVEPNVATEDCVGLYYYNDNNTWADLTCLSSIYPVCQYRLLSRKKVLFVKNNCFIIYWSIFSNKLRRSKRVRLFC